MPEPIDPSPAPISSDTDRLADLLDEALALGTEDREAFILGLEARDPARAAELRDLIAVLPDAETREAADKVERGESDPFVGEPSVGETIGGCVLDEVLGRGGIGTVFGARQIAPPRAVAVKVLRLTHARASHLRRFRTEAFALGRLVHPALARIYASGTERRDGSDLPYIVMERIDGGRSFVEWARGNGGPDRRGVALAMAEICDAMQHGHGRGVIHRDLKPTNVLIGADGRPHIIDFGIARLVAGDPADPVETVAGSLIGTPAYMAPEQFELAPSEIDTRIDIHALGVILYESLTGRRPYDIPRHLYFDAAQIIRSIEPAAPHLIDSTIPRDLSAIVTKAMAKDRDRRYATMSEFADDLRAFIEGRSVRARPESAPERFARLARRNPAWTTAITVSTVALVAASIVSFASLQRARADRDRARLELATIDAERGLIPFEGYNPLDLGQVEPPLVGGMIRRQVDDAVFPAQRVLAGNCMAGAISRDGTRWISGSDGALCGFVDFADARGGPKVTVAKANPEGAIFAAGWSADGRRAFVADTVGRLIEIAPDGTCATRLQCQQVLRGVLAADDGDRLLLVGAQAVGVYRLSTGNAEFATLASGQELGAAAWLGHGTAYAVLGDRSVVALEVPEHGAPVRIEGFNFRSADARTIAVSPDGAQIAVGSNPGRVVLADARTGAVQHVVDVRHSIWSIAYSRDGTVVYAGDRGGRVHAVASHDGASLGIRSSYSSEPVWGLGESADGTLVANIGGEIAFFGTSPRWSTRPQPLPSTPRAMCVTGPSSVRAIAADGIVRDLDLATGRWTDAASVGEFATAAISANGRRVATLEGSRLRLHHLAAASGSEVSAEVSAEVPVEIDVESGPFDRIRRLGWSADGSLLALIDRDRLRIVGVDGKLVAQATVDLKQMGRIAWYAPGRLALLADVTTVIDCIIDGDSIRTSTRKVLSGGSLHFTAGRWVLPSLNGSIAVSAPGGPGRIPSVERDAAFILTRHRDMANTAEISPDGTMLATGGVDGTVRLWSMATGSSITTFSPHTQSVSWLGWLPDGSGIVSIGQFAETRLLDSIPRAERTARESHPTRASE